MSKYLFLSKEAKRDPADDKVLIQDMATGKQSVVGVNKASYLAGKGELVTNGANSIEQVLALANGISNVNNNFKVTERCITSKRGFDSLVGYTIVNSSGSKIMAKVEDILYLIGRGLMVNCIAQSYKEDGMTIRGKGIKLAELPEHVVDTGNKYDTKKIPNECKDYKEVALAVMKYIKDVWEKGNNTKVVKDSVRQDALNLYKNNKILMQVGVNRGFNEAKNQVTINVGIPAVYLETRGVNHVNDNYKPIYYAGADYKKEYGFDKVHGDDIILTASERLGEINNRYLDALLKCSYDMDIQLPIQTDRLISMVGKWLKEVAMPNYKVFITGFVTESEVKKMLPNKMVSKIEGIIKEL